MSIVDPFNPLGDPTHAQALPFVHLHKLYHGHRRKSFRQQDTEELVELRARQRTFDGAYVRTALGNLGYALVILKVFTPEFARIGLLYVLLAVTFLMIAFFRGRRSEHDFAGVSRKLLDALTLISNHPKDIYRPNSAIVPNNPAISLSRPGPRLWGRPFRTSGDVVLMMGALVTALYVTLFTFIMRL